MSGIQVRNLSKGFRHYKSEWHRIANWLYLNRSPAQTFWALRDISIDVPPGTAVGIIGRNGAGKSTLLKLLTGTMIPTAGEITIGGRVSALLELGMGFNPELTGRENVYHASSLQGFGRDQIDERIDAIEAFAEVGTYFDAPVRTYSSGMQVRVAFAVATAWRPDVLIVDEALSVGDTYFQAKSFDRIREFLAEGTTLLLVSHDRVAVQALCSVAYLLEDGRIRTYGDSKTVFEYYNATLSEREGVPTAIEQRADESGEAVTRSGDASARIESASLLNEHGTEVDLLQVGQRTRLCITARVLSDLPEMVVGFMIRDRVGQTVFGTNSAFSEQGIKEVGARSTVTANFEFPANLGEGSYVVSIALHAGPDHTQRCYDWWDGVVSFEVVNPILPKFSGSSWLPTNIMVMVDD